MDEYRQIHQRLHGHIFCCVVGGAKVCARAGVDQPPLTTATLLEFFQPLGSSLLQKEKQKSFKGFLLTGRLLGLSNNTVHHHNLAVRKNHWGMSSLT